MTEEFARTAYDTHHDLFRHYSEQIFRTRISIITLILLSFGYVFDVLPWGKQRSEAMTISVLAYLASLLLVFLFSIETRYYRRLFQVTVAGRAIEVSQGVSLYFCTLDRAGNWSVFLLYIAGIAGLTWIALFNASKLSWPATRYGLALVAAIFPNLLALFITLRVSIEAKRLLGAPRKFDVEKERQSPESVPNQGAAPDSNRALRGRRR